MHVLKDIINRVQRQIVGWKKIFTTHISDKGLIYLEYIENSYNSTTTKRPDSKMGKGLRHFLREYVQMTNEQWKDAQYH